MLFHPAPGMLPYLRVTSMFSNFNSSHQVESINKGDGPSTDQKWTFDCEFCPKVLSNRCDLQQHTAYHFPATMVCRKCGKRCSDHQGIKKHMQIHSGSNYSYSCSKCSAAYTQKAGLECHYDRVHAGNYSTSKSIYWTFNINGFISFQTLPTRQSNALLKSATSSSQTCRQCENILVSTSGKTSPNGSSALSRTVSGHSRRPGNGNSTYDTTTQRPDCPMNN